MAANSLDYDRNIPEQGDSIVYELIRENKSLLLSLKEAENKVAELKLKLMRMEIGEEVYRLTVMLEETNNKIGRLQTLIAQRTDALNAICSSGKHEMQ